MKTSLWLQPQLNDIVFEHRNKAYGAFLLRSEYNQTMSRSILISIGFFVLSFLGFRFYLECISSSSFADKIVEIEKVVILDAVYKVEQPRIKPNPKPLPAGIKSQHAVDLPRVVIDEQAVEPVSAPTVIEIQPAVPGTSGEGTQVTDPIDIVNGEGSDVVSEEVRTAPVPIYLVDKQPEFPGGNEAMYKYLKKNLSFPDMAREINLSGTVVMQFMVSATGEIEQVTIVKTPSALFNRTSMQAIQGMPKWNPGIYRGKAVAVVFTLPLKFELL